MRVTDEECRELQAICHGHWNFEITQDEARAMLSNLLILLENFARWQVRKEVADDRAGESASP
jgi:hypothetical protein